VQLKGVAFTAVFAPLATLAILSGLKLAFGSLRVDDDAEEAGLDLSEHSESAYVSVGGGLGSGSLLEKAAHGPVHSVAAQRHA
jgi:hypothetical protein